MFQYLLASSSKLLHLYDKTTLIAGKIKISIRLPLALSLSVLAAAYCPCAQQEFVVQESVSPCRLVMYDSDLWAGGNGKHRQVRLELSVNKLWG